MPHTARRPAYSRAALMLVALLSVVLLGAAQGASCAMHGLGAARADAMSRPDMAGHSGMADHVGMAGMSHEGGGDSSEHHGCCSCIGDCTMAAPPVNAPTAATLLVALVTPEPRRPLDAEPRRPPSVEPDRRLPFANGPPHSPLV